MALGFIDFLNIPDFSQKNILHNTGNLTGEKLFPRNQKKGGSLEV